MASGNLNLLEDTPIRVVKGEVFNFDLAIYDVELDENDSETEGTRERSDLLSAVITHRVELADGTEVFSKVSTDSDQIEINADQVTATTKGTALIKYLAADTATLDETVVRWHFTTCVFNDGSGRTRRVIQRSRFYVDV